jgi:hypothetical protein
MAWNYIASQIASSSAGNAATTAAIDTTGATLLVVAVANLATEVAATVTDSQSNSWTGLTRQSNTGSVRLYYVANPTTNASHTFTAGAQAGFGLVIAVAACSGTASSPFDAENGSASGGNPGAVTNTGAGQLMVAACQNAAGGFPVFSAAIGAAFNNLQGSTVVGGVHFGLGIGIGYAYTGAAGSSELRYGGSSDISSVVATFKIAATGGSGGGSYGFA